MPKPLSAHTPTPADEAVDIELTQELSWNADTSGGIPSAYVIYFGETLDEEEPTAVVTTTSWTPQTLNSDTVYRWKIVPINAAGEAEDCPEWSFKTEIISSDKDQVITYSKNELLGNYPNPFNPSTAIKFVLINNSHVTIDIFNIKGTKVKTLANSTFSAGIHNIVWNGSNDTGQQAGSGVYLYRMKTEDNSTIKKMILLK
jgi:hypothetical protein